MKQIQALIIIAIVAGCAARYPMGLNKTQWEALQPHQQAEYQARQFEIDEEHRRLNQEMRQAQAQREAEARAAESMRIASLYHNAEYGDIVTITIANGVMIDGRNRYHVSPVAFDLVRGELKIVVVTGRNGNRSREEQLELRLSEDGNMVSVNESARNQDRISLVNLGWEEGNVQELRPFKNSWGTEFSGVSARVKFKSVNGEPTKVIIEHR